MGVQKCGLAGTKRERYHCSSGFSGSPVDHRMAGFKLDVASFQDSTLPDGIEYGDLLVLWSTNRSGLWIKYRVEIRSRTGRPLQVESVEAPLLDVISYQDQVALLIPGRISIAVSQSRRKQNHPAAFYSPPIRRNIGWSMGGTRCSKSQRRYRSQTGCPAEFEPGRRIRALDGPPDPKRLWNTGSPTQENTSQSRWNRPQPSKRRPFHRTPSRSLQWAYEPKRK